MKNNQPKRPENVPEKASYYEVKNEWQLFERNKDGIEIGFYKKWDIDGNLIEEGEYHGEEGDTYTYRAYTKLGELFQEGSDEKEVYKFMKNYRCKGNEYIYNFVPKEELPNEVEIIEHINFIEYIDNGDYFNSWDKLIYYDKNGIIIKEETDFIKKTSSQRFLDKEKLPLVYLQSALERRNYFIALNHLKTIPNFEKDARLKDLETILNILIDRDANNQLLTKEDLTLIHHFFTTYKDEDIINVYKLIENILFNKCQINKDLDINSIMFVLKDVCYEIDRATLHFFRTYLDGLEQQNDYKQLYEFLDSLNKYSERSFQDWQLENNDPIVLFIQSYLLELEKQKNYDQLEEVLDILEKWEIWGEYDANPFYESILVYRLKSGITSLTENYHTPCVKLLRLIEKGKKTSLSDWIEEEEEYKAFISFLKNIPKDYQYDETTETLTFNRDVKWDGDFIFGRLGLYFPDLKEIKIENICINGSFSIKGCFSSSWDFRDTNYTMDSIHIKGDLQAYTYMVSYPTIKIDGNLIVRDYVQFEWELAIVNKQINTPLIVLESLYDKTFGHAGGFSDNCVIITDSCCFGKLPDNCILIGPQKAIRNIKTKQNVHRIEDLSEDLYTKNDDGSFDDLLFEKLFEKITKGENIFREGYDPNAPKENKAAIKLKAVPELLATNNIKEVEKILQSISKQEMDDNELVTIDIKYYQTYILYQEDQLKNAKKIESNCKQILKLAKESDSKPKWEILLFAANYLATQFEANGEYKKSLELINRYNRGDEAHYLRKINLLTQLGKEKEILFPAYIAIEHYKTKELEHIANSPAYKKYLSTLENRSMATDTIINPPSSLINMKTIGDFDFEDEMPMVYKGDNFWNEKTYLGEGFEYDDLPKFEDCPGMLVVLGDLYVKGDLTSWQGDFLVTGNIFADEFHVANNEVECCGNLIVTKEVDIRENIAGSEVYIYGDIKTPILLSDSSNELYVGGQIDPETICIGINGYMFDEFAMKKVYTEKDINGDIPLDGDPSELQLYKHLTEGTLFR